MRAVVEDSPGAPAREILERAQNGREDLLTEARDFGHLVYAGQLTEGRGVVFVGCPEPARARLPQSIVSMVERVGRRLEGHFDGWTSGRLRLRRTGGR